MNPNTKNRYAKITGSIILSLLGVLWLSIPVLADGSITLTADKETAVVGDTLTVTYEAENPADAAEAPQIGISYDPNRLGFLECDKEYGGGEGGLLQLSETSASITFSILSGGPAEVSASAIFDGNGAEPATSSIYVSVDGEDTAAAIAAAAESSTGVEPGNIVSSDGSKIISTVFDDEFMPPLFHKTTTTYSGQTVEAASFDMGDITLLYVTDNTGENGNFNIFDPATESLSDFKMIQGIENRYIIILTAPESVAAPNGFTKAALQWDGLTLEAYAVDAIDSTVISDVPATDFFLLYAISSEGNKGWYLYDQVGGTYQRYLPIANDSVKTGEEEEGGFLSVLTGGDGEDKDYKAIAFRNLIIIGVMGLVMIVMFIFLLIFFFKLRDYQSYDYIDEDEETETSRQTSRREPSVEETSRIRASELARMEMGETFEPVDFDKLVNDPHAGEKGETRTPVKSVTTPADAAAKLNAAPAGGANAGVVGVGAAGAAAGAVGASGAGSVVGAGAAAGGNASQSGQTAPQGAQTGASVGGNASQSGQTAPQGANAGTAAGGNASQSAQTAPQGAQAAGASASQSGQTAAQGAKPGVAASAVASQNVQAAPQGANAGTALGGNASQGSQMAPQGANAAGMTAVTAGAAGVAAGAAGVAAGAAAGAAGQAGPAKGANINAPSVSDFVRPAKEEFKDDYEEEEEGGLFSRKSREERKKEKKRKKAMDFDEPEQIDWSSLEGTIKDTTDERRPKGGESPYSKLMQQQAGAGAAGTAAGQPGAGAGVAAAGATAGAAAAGAVSAAGQAGATAATGTAQTTAAPAGSKGVPVVETPKVKVDLPTDIPKPDKGKAVKPASQIHKETVPQQESNYWQQSTTQQYAQDKAADSYGDGQSSQGSYSAGSQSGQTSQGTYGSPLGSYSTGTQGSYGTSQQSGYSQGYDPYGQSAQGYDPYGQQYGGYQQGYDPYGQGGQGYDPYGGYQQGYDPYGGYQQGYDPYGQGMQGYDQYGQPYGGYPGYGQNPYNTQNIDLDDDFEFEFIDINRKG